MIFNTVAIYTLSFYKWCSFKVSCCVINCSLIKKYDFFVFVQNKGTCVATLDIKEGGVGVSDSNVVTYVKCSNLSVDVTP